MLRRRSSMAALRIAFSTSPRCMSFHTAWVKTGASSRCEAAAHVRFAPIAAESTRRINPPLRAITGREQTQQGGSLFDHTVGAGEQCIGEGKTECRRGLEIDRHPELDWQLDWQVVWLGAFQDAIDIRRGAWVIIEHFGSVRQQATDFTQ